MADNYSEVGGENAEILTAIIEDGSYSGPITSRNSAILKSILDEKAYEDAPQSEIEALLLALKEKIEQGGGGITYEYHYSNDKKICVRESSEGLLRWYFLGYHTTGESSIPEELSDYASINTGVMYSDNYQSDGTTKNGFCGFYQNNIRLWTSDMSALMEGDMYGIVDTGISATLIEQEQHNGYEEPEE
jgi:hypothetical protein